MIRMLCEARHDRRCAHELIESDRRYFELGAHIEPLSYGHLAWMPGLTHLAASCVIHRVDPEDMDIVPEEWLKEIEAETERRDVPLIRIYLDSCPPSIAAVLQRAGYRERMELGFLAPEGAGPQNACVRLRPGAHRIGLEKQARASLSSHGRPRWVHQRG